MIVHLTACVTCDRLCAPYKYKGEYQLLDNYPATPDGRHCADCYKKTSSLNPTMPPQPGLT